MSDLELLKSLTAASTPRGVWLGGLALLAALSGGCASRLTSLSGMTGGGAASAAVADDPFPTASEVGLSSQPSKDAQP